ncbi:MAG TPA: response regulator [Candidatus Saccharimonadales bacterium]|nr:response regulator [Candidatus Saccharimonadales bacterium]
MAQILMIEPDALLARAYRAALVGAGHAVHAVATAQAAITAADGLRPDLVILELQLVAHSGVEFLYEFRSYADWQDVPLIILSCVPPAEFAANAAQLQNDLGISAYLYKPQTTLQRLLNQVAAAIAAVPHV